MEMSIEELKAQNDALREEIARLKAQKTIELSTTPYDDAWRTLTTSSPKLLIPMVNEVFGEQFPANSIVLLKQNEHMFSSASGRTAKRITDTNFSILDESIVDGLLGDGFDILDGEHRKHYVFECESKAVSPVILVRIVEYAVKVGVESGSSSERTKLTVQIPQTAILSLRSTENTPDEMELEIVMEKGSGSSTVRIMKLSSYSIDAIFEKKLYLLIPFLLFNYEKQFQQIQNDKEKYDALMKQFHDVFGRIDRLIPTEEDRSAYIDLFTSKALRAMTHTVVDGLTEEYPKIREGVNFVVGGNILEFEASRIKREGEKKGAAEERAATAERMINKGYSGNAVADATGYDRNQINTIAQRLNRTVNWGDAARA